MATRYRITSKRIRNSYEGAGTGRRAAGWDAPEAALNAVAIPALPTLRKRSRAAVRNDPYAFSAISKRVSNLIGTGITPRSRLEDADLRATVNLLWEDWVDEADADGLTDFYGLQAMIARMVEESGECFVRLRNRRLDDGLAVPLQLQVLPPDFVPVDRNFTTRSGNVVRAGIEFNGIGKRVAYWMWQNHPGDPIAPRRGYNQLNRIPAEQVLHIFEPLEGGQLRGVPRLAPVLLRLKSLDNYDDAVLFRQEVSNLFAGFITRPARADGPPVFDPVTGLLPTQDRDGAPMVGLEPGTMQELLDGEEVVFSDPPDAGNTYVDFMRQQLMAAAVGVDLPYELLTGDMGDISDRTLRVLLNEFRRRIEQAQFGVYVFQLCRPVRNAWFDTAVLSGVLTLPDYSTRRREYLRTRWIPQGWAYIHPVQDVQGKLLEIAGGLASRSEHVLRTGYDAEQIDQENADDNARAERLGLHYTTDTGNPAEDKGDTQP
ncbi:phage portal protein [Pseudomonas panipatensis]|uniref:Phage portal protein, lambda family n=1 Tax=Pseudomonas panipatensis TaxID=428992 RepID=A0A1G8CVP0_9PSED|nr:phage portal protein [Pseudomonas panipatensis]SDH49374.1 phage portal protein, lambda family [Pseudomonas panipatensis]SMP63378.1 phage portal protein, lambda family [Pseudomonas panipatensis]